MKKQVYGMLICLLIICGYCVEISSVKAVNAGNLEIEILDDDGKSAARGAYQVWATSLTRQTSSSITNLPSYMNDWGKPASPIATPNGKYTFPYLLEGKYLVVVKAINGNDYTVAQQVDLKFSKQGASRKIKFVMTPDEDSVDEGKTGAISGHVNSQNWTRNSFTNATIIAQNKTSIWKTTSNSSTGAFQLFLPPGVYSVTLINNLNPTHRVYYDKISVQKGLAAAPLKGSSGIAPPPANLGFVLDEETMKSSSSTYKGKVWPGSTIRAYVINGTDYTLIGETSVKGGSAIAAVPFSLKIPKAQPGKTIGFVVEDDKWNRYAYVRGQFPLIDLDMSVDDTKAELGQPIDLIYKDESKLFGTSAVIQMKRMTDSTYSVLSLYDKKNKVGDYMVSNGKITLLPTVFIQPRFVSSGSENYNIRIIQDGFVQKDLVQTIGPSTTVVPSLSASIVAGTANDSIKIKVKPTTKTSNIKYQLSASPLSKSELPKLYELEPDGLVSYSYSSMPNIPGAIYYFYSTVRVYEIDNGRVSKFKEFPLNTKNTNASLAQELDKTKLLVVQGSKKGTTKVVFNGSEAYQYMIGNRGSKPRPYYKDKVKGYQTLTTNTDIKAKAGQSIYIVQVVSGTIIGWTEIPVVVRS